MTKAFKKVIHSLDGIFEFTNDFIEKNKIDDGVAYVINLAIEEIFTNMVKYNTENSHDVVINLNKSGTDLIISLEDFDVEPFDVTHPKQVSLDQSLKERKVGGLGLHLVSKMMDDITYEYQNRTSKVTLMKHLEK